MTRPHAQMPLVGVEPRVADCGRSPPAAAASARVSQYSPPISVTRPCCKRLAQGRERRRLALGHSPRSPGRRPAGSAARRRPTRCGATGPAWSRPPASGRAAAARRGRSIRGPSMEQIEGRLEVAAGGFRHRPGRPAVAAATNVRSGSRLVQIARVAELSREQLDHEVAEAQGEEIGGQRRRSTGGGLRPQTVQGGGDDLGGEWPAGGRSPRPACCGLASQSAGSRLSQHGGSTQRWPAGSAGGEPAGAQWGISPAAATRAGCHRADQAARTARPRRRAARRLVPPGCSRAAGR